MYSIESAEELRRGVDPLVRKHQAWPEDVCQVTPVLFASGEFHTREEGERLLSLGITHVIDCRGDSLAMCWMVPKERAVCEELGIAYLNAGVDDDFRAKDAEWFEAGINFALPAISQGGKVLVHCRMGINRGPSMAYAILRAQGWSPKTAEQLLRAARRQVGIAYRKDADLAMFELGYDDDVDTLALSS